MELPDALAFSVHSLFPKICMQALDSLFASLDVRGVRESYLHMMLQKIEMPFKEAVRRNMQCAGIERQSGESVKAEAVEVVTGLECSTGIDSPNSTICVVDSDMSESTSFSIELGRNETERNNALRRYQDFGKWIWKECFNSSTLCAMKHGKKRCRQLLAVCDYCHDIYLSEDDCCPSCNNTYQHSGSDFNFSKHSTREEKLKIGLDYNFNGSSSPLRIRLLKLQLALIEVIACLLLLLLLLLFVNENLATGM